MLNFFKRPSYLRFLVIIILIGVLFLSLFVFLRKAPTYPQFLFNLFFIFSIFIVTIFSASLWGILKSLKTIRLLKKMEEFAARIAKGDFGQKIEVKAKDETGKLAESLERMRKMLKENFENLEKEKERVNSIIENTGDSILMMNFQKEIILFNPAAEKTTGFTLKEVEGKEYTEFLKFFYKKKESLHPGLEPEIKFEFEDPIQEAIQTQKIVDIPAHTYLTDKHGREMEIEGRITPLREPEQRYIIFFRNVTRERMMEKRRSEFISIVSHQLRTPLSSIRWYTEMLLGGDAGPLKKGQKDFLNEVYQSTKRSIDLINNLLDVSRVERGKISIDPKPTQIKEVVEKVISGLSPLARAYNVEIVEKIKKSLPKIEIDSSKVYQVIQNIVENAIHYSEKKGKIILGINQVNHRLIFSCQDFGIGIPKKEQESVFKKFFRASNTSPTGVEGSGIGLYISRAFAERMGGKVWFESEGANKGTTFYLSLPIK